MTPYTVSCKEVLMFDGFTENSIKVVMLSQEEARRLGHSNVSPEFILLGLIQTPCVAAKTLKTAGVEFRNVRAEVEKRLGLGPGCGAEMPFTPSAKRLLEGAWEEARKLNVNYINPEHLLLSLLSTEDDSLKTVLDALGIEPIRIKESVLSAIPGAEENKRAESGMPEEFARAIEVVQRAKKHLIKLQQFDLAARMLEQEHELVKRFEEISSIIKSGEVQD
jgi:ATP-dependent Clp protease ATP-binding subunit ClpA